MSPQESEAWDLFLDKMNALRNQFDGTVPVALVLLPSHVDGEGEIEVEREGTARILWPSGFTQPEKADILRRAAVWLVRSRPDIV